MAQNRIVESDLWNILKKLAFEALRNFSSSQHTDVQAGLASFCLASSSLTIQRNGSRGFCVKLICSRQMIFALIPILVQMTVVLLLYPLAK